MAHAEHSLHQQQVVIVGGGSGIGLATAAAVRARGARVLLVGRSVEKLRAGSAGLNIDYAQADINEPNSLLHVFESLETIDHLVITAGPAYSGQRLAETNLVQAQAAFSVKFWGALRAIQLALPMLASRGSITLTSGLLARKFVPGQLVKSTINAALEAACKQLAKELAPRRVNVVSPGVTATEAYAGMADADRQAMFARVAADLPVGRVGQPGEVAMAFVLAMENSFMSGAVLDVDGGGVL